MAKKPTTLDIASWILCTIAALQLGFEAFGYNPLSVLGTVTQYAYVVIGIGGLVSVWHMFKHLNK